MRGRFPLIRIALGFPPARSTFSHKGRRKRASVAVVPLPFRLSNSPPSLSLRRGKPSAIAPVLCGARLRPSGFGEAASALPAVRAWASNSAPVLGGAGCAVFCPGPVPAKAGIAPGISFPRGTGAGGASTSYKMPRGRSAAWRPSWPRRANKCTQFAPLICASKRGHPWRRVRAPRRSIAAIFCPRRRSFRAGQEGAPLRAPLTGAASAALRSRCVQPFRQSLLVGTDGSPGPPDPAVTSRSSGRRALLHRRDVPATTPSAEPGGEECASGLRRKYGLYS